MGPGPTRYGPTSSFGTRTSVASSSVNLRGSDRSPPATTTTGDTGFYPGDPNDWSKEDDDYLHNYDPKDRRVSLGLYVVNNRDQGNELISRAEERYLHLVVSQISVVWQYWPLAP